MEDKTPIAKRRRADRYSAQRWLWSNSTLPRIRACKLHVAYDSPAITLKRTVTTAGNVGGIGGVQTCGSTWSCPVCAERVQAGRREEVELALAAAAAMGLQVAFVTFTVRHSRRHSLEGVWGAVSSGWRQAVGTGKGWATDKADYGVVGYLRLQEVTVGANGWHVHIHALIFMDPTKKRSGSCAPFSVSEVEALGMRMHGRWTYGVKKLGRGYAPSARHGTVARLVQGAGGELGKYFAKGVLEAEREGLAFEVTTSSSKKAGGGNTTPFGVLARLVKYSSGEVDPDNIQHRTDRARWAEWEAVSKGKRQLLWSNGMRALLGLNAEATDEELAADDALDGVVIATVHPLTWKKVARVVGISAVLTAIEVDDDGAALWDLLSHFEGWEFFPLRATGLNAAGLVA